MRAGSTQQGDGHSREWRRCSLGIWDRAEGDFCSCASGGSLSKGQNYCSTRQSSTEVTVGKGKCLKTLDLDRLKGR